MDYASWKEDLLEEIEQAAMRRTQKVFSDSSEERCAMDSQRTLLDLAEKLRALPANAERLTALFAEEEEIERLENAPVGEPEHRYRDAKEDLLGTIGFEHDAFESVDAFLDAVRAHVDEVISEYRLLKTVVA